MLNDIENPKFASRYQITSGLCGPLTFKVILLNVAGIIVLLLLSVK